MVDIISLTGNSVLMISRVLTIVDNYHVIRWLLVDQLVVRVDAGPRRTAIDHDSQDLLALLHEAPFAQQPLAVAVVVAEFDVVRQRHRLLGRSAGAHLA